MSSPQNEELLQAAVLGDMDALERLLVFYAPKVRQSLVGKINPRWQALVTEDDILQETCMEAFDDRLKEKNNASGALRLYISFAKTLKKPAHR